MGRASPASYVAPVSRSSRWTGSTARRGGRRASPIPLTPRKPPGPCSRDALQASPRPETAPWKPSGCWSWPSAPPGPLASERSTRCANSPSPALTKLRSRFKGLSVDDLVSQAAAMRPRRNGDGVLYATNVAMASLGRRIVALEEEIAGLDELIALRVRQTAPKLLELFGVGTDTAAALLVAAGDNPERLHSEAAFAHLCGVSPIEASSGKVTRRRLDRGGDRQANQALWRIVMVRLCFDPRTRAYMERRTKDGRSKREVIRILKRYVAREVFKVLPRA